MPLRHRINRTICFAIAIVLELATSARGSGLLLYETGAPDLGTASAVDELRWRTPQQRPPIPQG